MDASFAENIRQLSINFMPLMIAMVFHEYAHGAVAKRWGDKTAEEAGRMTINPIPHVDPMWTVVLPISMMLMGTGFIFGAAKPVPIDPRRFTKYRQGLFWVSAAGPLMNFLLATLSAIVFAALVRFVPETFSLREPLIRMAETSVVINFVLGIFNLLPLPPLDGSKMIQSFLSPAATIKYESFARFSLVIFLALMFTGALRFLLWPAQFASQAVLVLSSWAFGVNLVTQ
jgi:Zn-dependent protease